MEHCKTQIGAARRRHFRGSSLLELVMAGSFIAVSALGLSAAMISGLTLEHSANSRMSQVATAENIIEEMRLTAVADFNGLNSRYHQRKMADTSEGFSETTKQMLDVRIPLDETTVPGGHDLDSDGKTEAAVDPEKATFLVVDVEGGEGLRLRTAMLDLTGLQMNREESSGSEVVGYGETLDTTQTQKQSQPVVESDQEFVPGAITITDAFFSGKSAYIFLTNSGTVDLKPTAISVSPDAAGIYFNLINLNGVKIHERDAEQQPGSVFLQLDTAAVLKPGESHIAIHDFFIVEDSVKVLTRPAEVAVTIYFEDGTITTTRVRN